MEIQVIFDCLLSVLFTSIVVPCWQVLYETHPLCYFNLFFFGQLTRWTTDVWRRIINRRYILYVEIDIESELKCKKHINRVEPFNFRHKENWLPVHIEEAALMVPQSCLYLYLLLKVIHHLKWEP